jgi:DNA-binding transcriptional LysR family regulator
VAGIRGVLRGQLHVGAIQTLGVIDLPALLGGFHRAHPDVTIRLSHDAAPVLARAAADAQLDIAFIDGPTDPASLTRVEIGHDDLILAVPRSDPLAKRASIALGDPALRERDFVDYRADSALHAQIDVACAAAGLARRTVCEAQNMQYLAELVQHGLGIPFSPHEPARGHRRRLDHPHHAAATPRHLRGRRRQAPAHRSRTSPAARRRHQQSTQSSP